MANGLLIESGSKFIYMCGYTGRVCTLIKNLKCYLLRIQQYTVNTTYNNIYIVDYHGSIPIKERSLPNCFYSESCVHCTEIINKECEMWCKCKTFYNEIITFLI